VSVTKIATVNAQILSGTTTNVTVPTGVTTAHLGVLLVADANNYADGSTISISGWTARASSPAAGNNSNVFIFTRNGGVQAGDTLPVVSGGVANAFTLYGVWYNTGGYDVAVIGTPGGRGGTSEATIPIPGITTTVANQDVLVVASERTTATGTVISSWSPITPTTDYFLEDPSATANTSTSAFFGHFTQATAGATGTITPTYNSGSGNGVGMLMGVAAPSTNLNLLKLGANNTTLYVGASSVSAAYMGTTQVYP
jgi:hypothetical protein